MARKSGRKVQQDLSQSPEPLPASLEMQVTPPSRTSFLRDLSMYKAIGLIVLAALYSPVSQLSLSPVYGSVGSDVYHDKGLIATALFTILARGEAARYLPVGVGRAIPTFAFWIPTIQYVLFRFSSALGNPNGPFLTECLTCYPLVALSLYVAVQCLDSVGIRSFQILNAEIGLPAGSFLLFTMVRQAVKGLVVRWVGSSIIMTRVGLQMIIAMLYSLILPSTLFWPSIPSVAFTMLGNVHNPLARTTDVLNNTLALYNYALLERRESLTGYISVLEDRAAHYRVMRCDHSLLGGEWTMSPPDKRLQRVKEPIYAIFTMLEAVRLVKTEGSTHDLDKNALNIGLGIGTAPSALIAHGISTTILELDPVVYDFARQYFGLPSNHTVRIGDAADIVVDMKGKGPEYTYDFIIHDVFTGGAEPVDLFTFEFLTDLEALLKPSGVIAINYAGDLALPSASLIYRTIRAVFPSCRVFREVEAPFSNTATIDYTNMVFFCTREKGPIQFRIPEENDFLGSGARQEFLLPKHEIVPKTFQTKGDILMRGKTKELEKWQARSAIGHWEVMRSVIPDVVWENW